VIINLQQGIVTYPSIGNQQTFLSRNGSFVSLNATSAVVDITFAHGAENYFFTESADIVNAWGPIAINVDHWLYWDIDLRTAVRTFGLTTIAPIYSPVTPSSPVEGLHWFNTTATKMFVYVSGQFREVVRLFAAKVNNNNFSSLAIGNTLKPFAGSQAGLNNPNISAGRIIADSDGKPIRRSNGTFFTTESTFFINGSPINTIRIETSVVTATAKQNLAKFQVVKYVDFGAIASATYADLQQTVIALIMRDTLTGGVSEVCIQGIVTNSYWAWTTVGAPLWVDNSGSLTLVDPHITFPLTYPVGKPPIARTLSQTSVFFG
jgi:hypothetical protein